MKYIEVKEAFPQPHKSPLAHLDVIACTDGKLALGALNVEILSKVLGLAIHLDTLLKELLLRRVPFEFREDNPILILGKVTLRYWTAPSLCRRKILVQSMTLYHKDLPTFS